VAGLRPKGGAIIKVKTSIKAGGTLNHNETLVRKATRE